MVTFTTNWLDSLVKHSIFETNETHVADSIKKYNFNNNVEKHILQHHTCVLTMRDNDLFVAVGSKIRVLNLTEFKEAHKKSKSDTLSTPVYYKLLDTPDIDFPIQALALNSNGRLLSIKGENALVVVCLPRQGFGDVSMIKKNISCRTLSIGKSYYSNVNLLNVKWHPLSETHTHLVVLDSNSTLRIFDVSADIEEPEQSFDLSPTKNRGSSANESVASFSLGGISQEKSGWEPLTVYYALQNGQIYSLCPVIPFQSTIHQEQLNNLIRLTEAKSKNEKSKNTAMAHLHQTALQWLHDLSRSIVIGKLNSECMHSVSHNSTMALRRQGPFLVNYEQKLTGNIQVTDILHVASESVNLILLALSNGYVQNHILSTEINPQWEKTDENLDKELNTTLSQKEFLPTAIIYETVDIKNKNSPGTQSIRLISDPFYNETIYSYHATGVTAINIKNWVTGLKEAIKNKDVKRWLEEKKKSEVRNLVNTAPLYGTYAPVAGICIITNAYLSYGLITVTFDYKLAHVDLNLHRDEVQQTKSNIKHLLKNIGQDEQKYEPLLSLPLYKKPSQLESLPKHAKIVVPRELEDSKGLLINKESLDVFSDLAGKISNEANSLNKVAVKSKERLQLQQKEFEKQVVFLVELYNKYQKHMSLDTKEKRIDRVHKIKERHSQLRLRMDDQVRSVLKFCSAQDDNDWAGRLNNMQEKLDTIKKYSANIKTLQSQLLELQNKPQKETKFSPTHMTQSQIETLLATLTKQTDPIEEIKKRIKNMDKLIST